MTVAFDRLEKNRAASINYIIEQALRSVDPYQCVAKNLAVKNEILSVGREKIDLGKIGSIYNIGTGKAVIPMACAVQDILGDRISSGYLISKHQLDLHRHDSLNKIRVTLGNHPVPDMASIRSTQGLLDFLDEVKENDLIVNLISGGGSALMTAPCEGISLSEYKQITTILLNCGAAIHEINIIRKHIDRLKGGGLARLIYPARIVSMILSDVIGDDTSMIASGPTAVDSSTFKDALAIFKKYDIEDSAPKNIIDHFHKGNQGEVKETLKAEEDLMGRVTNIIVGGLETAIMGAKSAAIQMGFNTRIVKDYIRGEASEVGDLYGSKLKEITKNGAQVKRPFCMVAGGETTVTIHGKGIGGRNQELALGAVKKMQGLKDCCLVTLATDGEDGPTDAAGAFVTGSTLSKAEAAGLDIDDYLKNNNSYQFFKRLDNLIKIGPTGTNVNDLLFLFAF